jgi:Ca-activated chloride channel family protein
MRARAALPLLIAALLLAAPASLRAKASSEKELFAALPEDDRKWLAEFVAPIILPEEKRAFLELTQPHEREDFKEEFWKRRERDNQNPPLGPGYRQRYEELRRLAETQYDHYPNDAAAMVIHHGEPASIEPLEECGGLSSAAYFRGLEIWTYNNARGLGQHYFFYRRTPAEPRRMWVVGTPDNDIFNLNACRKSFPALRSECPPIPSACPLCADACRVFHLWEEISSRQGSPAGGNIERAQQTQQPERVPLEGLEAIKTRSASSSNPDAKKIPVEGPATDSAQAAVAGGPAPGAVVQASQSTPASATKPAAQLTDKERLASLPEEDRKWLTELVAPIIFPEEKKAFIELTEARDREAFKEEFWKRREQSGLKPPLGPGYRDRYAQMRELVESQYDHWPNDAARMVIRSGEPASIDRLEMCHRTFRDLEIWTYSSLGGPGAGLHYFFYRRSPSEARRLWTVGTPDAEVFSPRSCRKSFQELTAECKAPNPQAQRDDPCSKTGDLSGSTCEEACKIVGLWSEISSRQGSVGGGSLESAQLLAPPDVSLEGLDAVKQRSASSSDPNAAKIGVEGPSGSTFASAAPPPAGKPAPPAAASRPASGGVVKTASSEKERLAALSEEDRKWLNEFVAPIILPDERKAFLELTQPHEREAFKEEFWKRRERENLQPPLGPGYRFRYEELRRLADTQYDRWPHDAARMVIRYGEPADVRKIESCDKTFREGLEIWTYNPIGTLGIQTRHYIFYRRAMMDPRRLWVVGTPNSDVFQPMSCRKSFGELANDCHMVLGDPCNGPVCGDACDVYKIWSEISSRQGSVSGGMIEEGQLLAPVEVPLEGLESIKQRSASSSDPNAKKIGVEGPSSTASADAKAAVASIPAPVRRKLSKKEIQELTERLPQKYRDFLELTDLIITDDERQVFLQIGADYEKDRFIEGFWKRRSTDPRGLRTDFKTVYIQRFVAAKEQFKNMRSDRAKIFLVNGAPDAVIVIDCQDIYVPIQIWFYERLEALKSKVYLIFYRQNGIGEYKLWLPLDGEAILTGNGMSFGPGARRVDVTQCPEYRTVRQAESYSAAVLGSGAMSMAGASVLFQPPTVETEGVDQILTMTTDLAANAASLGVTKLIRFPDERANRIGVDLSLLVPRADLKSRQLGEETFYNVDVIGEVVKDERLIDNFKYRFDIPTGDAADEKIPLTVRRYLYPGEYKLVLKISDGNQNAEGRITDTIKVPERPDAPPPLQAAARVEGRTSIEKAKDTGLGPAAISLIPIAREIATGLQRFETRVAEGISAVDFYLNGSRVMTKTRAPFEADLNLGPLPRKQIIRVVAYGPGGRAVGEDEYTVNEGREVFRVRILSPEKGARVTGPTPVAAAVAVPEGKALQKVEFYSNETRVATLYQAPWEQTVNIRESKSLGYVRVVGTLEDGTIAEDVRYVNAPSYISEVSVDAVELYTAVTDKSGRPVAGLQAGSFKVFEDAVVQKIESFEYVKNVPLSVGVMIDTSASMLESLPEAQQAAITFLDYSIGPKDRGFTISFDSEPYILSKLTNRKDKLYRSLAGLRAEGSTALYDAIVYGLYQFTGVKGKKCLVILTDGKDTASKFDYDTLLEYVRKSGIAIYGIGLKISGSELDVKHKLNKLSQVTGGQSYFIDSVKNLESIYRQINDELRSQYLLTYYSTNAVAKDKWRKVEVKVEPTNLQARTLSGYYP